MRGLATVALQKRDSRFCSFGTVIANGLAKEGTNEMQKRLNLELVQFHVHEAACEFCREDCISVRLAIVSDFYTNEGGNLI
jgi:hypothetical protein